MSERNRRRMDKKSFAKKRKEIVADMTMLQRYVLNGLEKGKITHNELVEMSVYYVISELEKQEDADPNSTTGSAIERVRQLNNLGE